MLSQPLLHSTAVQLPLHSQESENLRLHLSRLPNPQFSSNTTAFSSFPIRLSFSLAFTAPAFAFPLRGRGCRLMMALSGAVSHSKAPTANEQALIVGTIDAPTAVACPGVEGRTKGFSLSRGCVKAIRVYIVDVQFLTLGCWLLPASGASARRFVDRAKVLVHSCRRCREGTR